MIGDRELIQKYIRPYYGIKNPNLYVELPSLVVVINGFVLLEDDFYLLQEDGIYKLGLEQ